MDTQAQSEVFFLISSIGFVLLWILGAVFLFYLIRAMRTIDRVVERAEKEVDTISDATKEMIEDIKDSTIFNFLFKKKRSKSAKLK
jgi:Na+-transporting methylmalonyl-CoA/oxaloacetate decarboxylase gamma subunit